MRTGPGTDYDIFAQLPIDTPAQIVGEQEGWYQILTPWGSRGWVLANLFKVASYSPDGQDAGIGSAATVGVVNMRAGPGTNFPIVSRLSDSTVLEVLVLQGAWYKVRSPVGDIGWVAAENAPLDWIPNIYGGGSAGTGSYIDGGAAGSVGNMAGGSYRMAVPAVAAGNDVVRIVARYLGSRYVWGGSDPSGFDCSGLTWYVYRQVGVSLPGGSAQQFSSKYGDIIASMSSLAPGDLVFFERTTEDAGITHVGIYVGDNKMIAARSERLGVRYVSLLDPFWSSRFVGAVRPYR